MGVSAQDVPAAAGWPAGRLLAGRYRLTDRIGGPDWAALWKGADELLRRPVTVRVFRSGPLPARVTAALQGAGRLTDPRLARIYDADDRVAAPHIVSEWAPGERLDDLLGTGLPEHRMAARIVAEVAAALAAAHAAGQAHQCLGLGDIRWDRRRVKVTGLGIEAAVRGLPPGAHPAGVAADTRALGAVLYALLSGYWPGGSTTVLPPAPTHRGVLYEPVQLRAGVPRSLSTIACQALLAHPAAGSPLGTPAALVRALCDAHRPAAASRVRRAAAPVTAAERTDASAAAADRAAAARAGLPRPAAPRAGADRAAGHGPGVPRSRVLRTVITRHAGPRPAPA